MDTRKAYYWCMLKHATSRHANIRLSIGWVMKAGGGGSQSVAKKAVHALTLARKCVWNVWCTRTVRVGNCVANGFPLGSRNSPSGTRRWRRQWDTIPSLFHSEQKSSFIQWLQLKREPVAWYCLIYIFFALLLKFLWTCWCIHHS